VILNLQAKVSAKRFRIRFNVDTHYALI